MLLDKPNAELLKLVALCKDFPCEHRFQGARLLSDINIERLIKEGLMCVSKSGRYYRVTRLGYYLLNHIGIDYKPEQFRETNVHTLARREQHAMVMLTLMLAGADVFTSAPSQLCDDNTYLPSNVIRRVQRERKRNLTGNTRFTGLMGGSGYVSFYVNDPQDLLYYKNEMKIASSFFYQAGFSVGYKPAVVYMGTDYQSLCNAVTGDAGKGAAGSKSNYRSAYDKFDKPVYLCPCNIDGAIQMRIMLQPDYRKRIVAPLLKNEAAPPNPIFGNCDGMYRGDPYVVCIDMDLKRISGVISEARKLGKTALLFARVCQLNELAKIYKKDGVRYFSISDDVIKGVFSFSSLIIEPEREPYVTVNGGYVDDETIRCCCDMRKGGVEKEDVVRGED